MTLTICRLQATIKSMKFQIKKTKKFDTWLKQPRDRKAVLNQFKELTAPALEILDITGQWEAVFTKCVCTQALDTGCINTIHKNKIIVLLHGGNKSTQKKDINKAKTLAKNI